MVFPLRVEDVSQGVAYCNCCSRWVPGQQCLSKCRFHSHLSCLAKWSWSSSTGSSTNSLTIPSSISHNDRKRKVRENLSARPPASPPTCITQDTTIGRQQQLSQQAYTCNNTFQILDSYTYIVVGQHTKRHLSSASCCMHI